ncbi:hypothetical protein N7474_009376 [Penicillium riverlandense]|uniref:uncharacterized protein n=1 Tax=Penicillium riverlandense TaxID=1903569 RepID=UPI002549AFB8|nr:uncharacterized protein N7474_009376 [Penicillium riverlandense]KAJ5808107.1 hypothetical protein N7474_009376 [Penicillium riverlandense]
MELLILGLVCLASNLWGLYGPIPFTAIQPSRPFLDRALGSLQLTSAVYALDQFHPYLLPNSLAHYVSLGQEVMTDFVVSNNITMFSASDTAASIKTDLFTASLLSDEFPSDSDEYHLPKQHPSKPETCSAEAGYVNVILVLLIIILAVQLKETIQRGTDTNDKEIQLLRTEQQIFFTELQSSHKIALDATHQRLDYLEERTNQLFGVGNELLAHKDMLAAKIAASVADGLNSPDSEIGHHLRDVQDGLATLRESAGQNSGAWMELAELLRAFPSNVASAIATSLAEEIMNARMLDEASTGVSMGPSTGMSSRKSSGLERSIWAVRT